MDIPIIFHKIINQIFLRVIIFIKYFIYFFINSLLFSRVLNQLPRKQLIILQSSECSNDFYNSYDNSMIRQRNISRIHVQKFIKNLYAKINITCNIIVISVCFKLYREIYFLA